MLSPIVASSTLISLRASRRRAAGSTCAASREARGPSRFVAQRPSACPLDRRRARRSWKKHHLLAVDDLARADRSLRSVLEQVLVVVRLIFRFAGMVEQNSTSTWSRTARGLRARRPSTCGRSSGACRPKRELGVGEHGARRQRRLESARRGRERAESPSSARPGRSSLWSSRDIRRLMRSSCRSASGSPGPRTRAEPGREAAQQCCGRPSAERVGSNVGHRPRSGSARSRRAARRRPGRTGRR